MCTQGQHHVNMKAEIKVMLLHVKEDERLPTNHQKLGERHGTDPHSPQKEPTLPTP